MSFSKYEDFHNDQKIINNYQIFVVAKRYFPKSYKKIKYLALDGKTMLTTKTLIDCGVPSENIVIVERDFETYKQMKKRKIGTIHFNDLEIFLKREDIRNIKIVYFDFLNQIEGSVSENDHPLETLNAFFKNTDQKKVVLAFTFACRGAPGRKLKPGETMIDYISKFLETNFEYNQFEIIEKIEPVSYHRNNGRKRGMPMAFFVYVLQKNKNIDRNVVEFYHEKNWRYSGYRDIVKEEDRRPAKKSKNMDD